MEITDLYEGKVLINSLLIEFICFITVSMTKVIESYLSYFILKIFVNVNDYSIYSESVDIHKV